MGTIIIQDTLFPFQRFHSINVPSEWEQQIQQQLEFLIGKLKASFHSINVPSEWELNKQTFTVQLAEQAGFHSINVPSEWELTQPTHT